jgi:hypothetical protein
MKSIFLTLIVVSLFSCRSTKEIGDYWNYSIPKSDFNDEINFPALDYTNNDNWMFHHAKDDYQEILPKNYNQDSDYMHDISVFYIHPTTLYDGISWNADTLYFKKNNLLELCLENQASIFAGITKLYAPHYREMHIYSYTDTLNGYKAFDIAYQDVLDAFKYFVNHIDNNNFIIASHSQGTNHAVRLIKNYISSKKELESRLILSYLIGMQVNKNELQMEVCNSPYQSNCFLSWRSFNENYFPTEWNYGDDFVSVNPITFTTDTLTSLRKKHLGILLPNQKIRFKKTIVASNHLGMLWIKLPKSILFNKFRRNNYHTADFNLYWMNVRTNLQQRLSKFN